MGKASSTKKVTRAASTGGGRTNRGRTPWLWYLSIGLGVALGMAGGFAQLAGVTISETEIHLPGDKVYKNGDKCETKDGSKAGEVQAKVNGKPVAGDPKKIKIKNGQNVTIAFVPKGAEIPETPSVE